MKRKPSPEVQRRKVAKWRAANWERFSEGKLARNAALRAKAKGAGNTPPDIRRQRSGYRQRTWSTRVGSIGLEIPKLRNGAGVHRCGAEDLGTMRKKVT